MILLTCGVFIPGPHFHRRLLGQMRGQPGVEARLPRGDVPAELRGALHRHHPDDHQPLLTDGAEGRSLTERRRRPLNHDSLGRCSASAPPGGAAAGMRSPDNF